MRHFVLIIKLFFCLSLSAPIFAQQAKIDSMKNLLLNPIPDTTKIQLWNFIATGYLLIQPDSNIFYAEKAEILSKKIKYKIGEYTAINAKGGGNWKKGNLAKALQYFKESYILSQKAADPVFISQNINNIALIYESMGNYETSLTYYHKLLLVAEAQKEQRRIGITYHNMGQAYTNLAKYDSAEFYLLKSLPYAQKYLPPMQPFNYLNLGDVKLRKKEYEAAQTYLMQALVFSEQFSDQENLSTSYRMLATISIEKGNFNLANEQIVKALHIVEKSQIKENMYPVYNIYSKILKNKGDFENALKYKDLYVIYRDSVQSETSKNGLQIFEYEKTQGEVALLKAQQAQENSEKKFWLFLLLGGLFFMIIIAFFVLRSRKKIQESYQKLSLAKIEIEQQKEELQTANEELYQIQEEIIAQRDLLESKNGLLEQYKQKIGKSIEAAQMIQKAILPPKAKMKELFDEHFVLFRPKDIVSGDFWWANEIDGKKYLIVADCTGHGVSGAMLSMIGSSLLDRIIRLLGITEPSEILTTLHEEIKAVLQQDQNKNNEGMDIAIVHWHYDNTDCIISFAAAKRPLYYTFEGKTEKIIGSRRNIGGTTNSIKSFETNNIVLSKGSCLYLSSDGFADQNDTERNNFSEKRLIDLLQENQDLPMEEQKEILKTQLTEHTKGTEQRDDILMIGVRI